MGARNVPKFEAFLMINSLISFQSLSSPCLVPWLLKGNYPSFSFSLVIAQKEDGALD